MYNKRNRSNKRARSRANRKLRSANRLVTEDREIYRTLREVSDVWSFPSDGLGCWGYNLNDEVRELQASLDATMNCFDENLGWVLVELLEFLELEPCLENLEKVSGADVAEFVRLKRKKKMMMKR
jgi:hypothetical protein